MSADTSGAPQERALRHVAALSSGGPLGPHLRVTLNFHPDRLVGDRPILLGLANDGLYHSQFVTGTSNGGLTAHPGRLRRYPDYRGQEYVDLATEIAVDGHLDPRIIGDAACTGRYDSQALKKVWHCLARFGSPFDESRPDRHRRAHSPTAPTSPRARA